MDVSNLTPSQLIAVCMCALIGCAAICYLSFRVAVWIINLVCPLPDAKSIEEKRIDEYFKRVYGQIAESQPHEPKHFLDDRRYDLTIVNPDATKRYYGLTNDRP